LELQHGGGRRICGNNNKREVSDWKTPSPQTQPARGEIARSDSRGELHPRALRIAHRGAANGETFLDIFLRHLSPFYDPSIHFFDNVRWCIAIKMRRDFLDDSLRVTRIRCEWMIEAGCPADNRGRNLSLPRLSMLFPRFAIRLAQRRKGEARICECMWAIEKSSGEYNCTINNPGYQLRGRATIYSSTDAFREKNEYVAAIDTRGATIPLAETPQFASSKWWKYI